MLSGTSNTADYKPSGQEVYSRPYYFRNGSYYQGGTVYAGNYDLLGHNGLSTGQAINFPRGTTDITATSNGTMPTVLGAILNTTLANNGVTTRTHALVSGSPAVDAVANGCPLPDTDQRGGIRPAGTFCDIGSFELTAT